MDINKLKSLAARQWRDYQRGSPGTAFADPDTSLTLDEAYEVQTETAMLRCSAGDTIAGYKIGCIGADIVEQFGMSGPIYAHLFRSEIRHCGEALRHLAFAVPAIEGEMAVRIGNDGEIASAFPVVELHHFVFRAPRKTLSELVANNGINAGAVISPELETTPLSEWDNARTLSVAINGTQIDSGALWAMPGGAVEAVEWLRSALDRTGKALRPGDLVLTGTPLGLHSVQIGDHVVVSVDDRKCVDCRFE